LNDEIVSTSPATLHKTHKGYILVILISERSNLSSAGYDIIIFTKGVHDEVEFEYSVGKNTII